MATKKTFEENMARLLDAFWQSKTFSLERFENELSLA